MSARRGNVEPGQRFGRLTSVRWAGESREGAALWECACDCGGHKVVRAAHLRQGATQSCGCLQKERASAASTRHGGNGTKLYRLWRNVKNRCNNESGQDYARYGGRGITMYPAWQDDFVAFATAVGEPPADDWTLERVDNDKGYEPGNVRWATRKEQARNTSRSLRIEYRGQVRPLPDWCDFFGVSYTKVVAARTNGEDPLLALHRRVIEKCDVVPLRQSRTLTVQDVKNLPPLPPTQ